MLHFVTHAGTVFEFGDVFCFTNFLTGFSFRVRGRVRVQVGVGGGFRVWAKVRATHQRKSVVNS